MFRLQWNRTRLRLPVASRRRCGDPLSELPKAPRIKGFLCKNPPGSLGARLGLGRP